MVACACNPCTGKAEIGGFSGLTSLTGKLQIKVGDRVSRGWLLVMDAILTNNTCS